MAKTTSEASGGKPAGEGDGGDGGESGEPAYVREADLDRKLNAAISAHFKRFEKKLAPLLAKTDEAEAEGEGEAGAGTSPPAGKKPVEKTEDPALKRLEKQLADMKRERDEERKAREEATAQGRKREERAALATALRDAGVANAIQAKAAQALLETEGRVVRDPDTDLISFKTLDKYGSEVLVPLGDGLSAWAKSDEGAHFMPPRKIAGSGAGPARGSGKGDKLSEKQAKDAEARAVLAALLSDGVEE